TSRNASSKPTAAGSGPRTRREAAPRSSSRCRSQPSRRSLRQLDREGRSLSLAGALGADGSAVQLDQVPRDRQAEPVLDGPARPEAFEEVQQALGPEAVSAVDHLDPRARA